MRSIDKKEYMRIWYHGADHIGPKFTYSCGVCGKSLASGEYRYCPYCGVDLSTGIPYVSDSIKTHEIYKKGYNAAKQDMIRLLQKEV